MKKNGLTIGVGIALVITIGILLFKYYTPEPPCVEELVSVVCDKADKGEVECYGNDLKISCTRKDSITLYIVKIDDTLNTIVTIETYYNIRINDLHKIEIIQNSEGKDSVNYIEDLVPYTKEGSIDFVSGSIDDIPFGWRSARKIYSHIAIYKDKQNQIAKEMRKKAEIEAINRACDLAKSIK